VAIPTVRAVGTVQSGVGAITLTKPAGTANGDLLIAVVDTFSDDVAAFTISGFTEAPSSPVDDTVGAATMLHVLYKIEDGTTIPASSDSGNRQQGRILGITTGTFDSTTPFNQSIGQATLQSTATTAGSMTGFTTDRNDCLIVMASAADLPDAVSTTEFGLFVNTALANITERIDNASTAGNGGAIGCDTGELATLGAIGTTTFTSVTSSVKCHLVLAVQPPLAVVLPNLNMARYRV